MLRTVNVKEEILITILLISDLSYAWELIGKYVPLMQEQVKRYINSINAKSRMGLTLLLLFF